jgi:2-keto-4-pentenoate hydratase/2-oxohepta-3-ene-1,7-dioic acid hydratase in catechol pathway
MNSISFIDGRKFFPTKIVAIGQNYSEHIKEMSGVRTEQPLLFLKPNSALCEMQKPLQIPKSYGSVHHEIELAVCIGQTCSRVPVDEAPQYIAGYGMALDLTLRDMQGEAKKKGAPWAMAKGFDFSCPVSPFIPAEKFTNVTNLSLQLTVNGIIRQAGSTSQMLTGIPELIAFASQFFTLETGDLLLTGTPAGVGPLLAGDALKISITGFPEIFTTCY